MDQELVEAILPLVLDKDMYSRFQEYLLARKAQEEFKLSNLDNVNEIYRTQGKLAVIKELTELRERVRDAKNRVEEDNKRRRVL